MNFKAGNFIQTRNGYKAFHPEKINHRWEIDSDLLPLVEQAANKLGELNAFGELVPDIKHFIKLHVVKEATMSSRIEGTATNMEEALLKEEEIQPEKRNDWREVSNYIESLNECVSVLGTLPLSTRLLKQAHKILMQGVRGEHKMPGEFRKSQNWIGGATLKDATFIPPAWQNIEELMGDLENFIHSEQTELPHIIKIALAHYQFETIHPFLDGNGRVGRLMITLYFVEAGILRKPVLYLSDFFERNRSLYYENLTVVRAKNDLKSWLRFFIIGLTETAEKATKGLRKILDLKKECESDRLPKLGRKMHTAQTLLQHLFINPVIRPNEVAGLTHLSLVSSYKLIEDFEKLNILREVSGSQRNRIYIFHEYFNVFNE